MNSATEFDVGPLTWVKSEIDLALGRADDALLQYTASVVAGVGDLTQIKFCRTHLHQVQGALTIVGLDGVTQFAEALEAMLEAIEQQLRPAGEASIALAQRALAAIGHYLDDLINGQPNQPLRLLSIYREVQAACGVERARASDLFFPDLSARPPRRVSPAKKVLAPEFQRLVRQERARFERGLLAWLRAPQDRSGVSEMLGAVKRIEATQDAASARAFWWVASGFLAALAEGSLPAETDVKQLCARIDLQIRRLFEGSKNVAERLMRDALYFVAHAEGSNSAVQLVKTIYQLQASIPTTETAAPAAEETVRRKLREVIVALEETWNKYCAGTVQSLPLFREYAHTLSTVVEQLGHTDYRRLAQAIAAAANWLAEDSARYSEAVAMETATAILLAQNAQENYPRLGSDFAHQVDVTVARIHGCLAGTPPQPGSEIALLDEMSRLAQEKLLVGQVAKEIQSNLVQIEQVLDAFFRDIDKRADIDSLDVPLRQIGGALSMMRHDGAVAALRECSTEIKRFANAAYLPLESDFERVASQLSIIGFFVDALQHGATDFASFSRLMQSGSAPAGSPKPQQGDASEADDEAGTSVSVEQEVEQQKRQTRALLSAVKDQPADAALRAELKLNLEALQNDADLVADGALGEQTKAVLSALATGGNADPQIDRAMATLNPKQSETLQPSAETIQLAQASSEEIDAELLAIFLEEANEVLATIAENLQVLNVQPHNVEVLTIIRRAFHTLKGSGRMVGLKDVGEAAWAVEQTLNLWLRQELEVTADVLALISQAHVLFAAWVKRLESHSGGAPDAHGVIMLAESLRRGYDEAHAAATPMTVPAATRAEGSAPAPETKADDDAAAQEEPRQSAEIITVDFPQAAASHDDDLTIDLEEINLPDFEIAAETPSPRTEVSAADPRTADPDGARPGAVSPALYEIFSEEASTHLATLQHELPLLEANALAPTAHAMYRAAHTLAGISATVGVPAVNRLGVALEHALLRRDYAAQPGSRDALLVLRQAIDELALLLSALGEQREPELASGLLDSLDALYPAQVLGALAKAPELPDVRVAAMPGAALDDQLPPLETAKTEFVQNASYAAKSAPLALHDEIDEQLLPIFLEEALDLNQGIATQLRAWRSAPANGEAVRTLARLLHTQKGSARMAGAMNLGEITHAIETRVEQALRSGSAAPEVIDEIDNDFDAVLHIIERLQAGESLDQPAPEPAANAPATHLESESATASYPALPPAGERRTDQLRAAAAVDIVDIVDAADAVSAAAPRATVRVRADLIDRLVNEAGELSIARTRIEGEMRSLKESLLDLTENVIRLRRQLREIEIQAESQMQSRTALADEKHAGFDPLEFDRFTRFQELTRMMAESVNDVGTVQQHLLKNLDDANAAIIAQARLNREVQQELMAVRMVPFGSLADRLYRIVRQTSKELGKRANLEISGGQVELDRSVLDKMGAPLEHMLRNAVVHGIEERELRMATGKPDIGEISLALKREGNEIIVSFSDDGGGLNFERIRARAIATGLLGANEEADAARLGNLIFTPGFTTAAEVSQVAGRGIGMDVVKTEVGSLGGRIEIVSTSDRGTEFRLYIPLTLAVTKALLVRAGNRRYAIPSVMIEQVLDLKEAALTRTREAGMAEWMGYQYPFYYLPQLLGDTQALPEQHRQYWALLLRSGMRRIAVQVDELMGNKEIVVKNIGPQLARVIGVDGATVLGNGQVVLILNPIALSIRPHAANFTAPVPSKPVLSEADAAIAKLPTVMVVDDSLTVRKITGRLLAREGYQVITAKDGVEALELLLDVLPDVMLVDIEMPRLDGFDLTRNIRADARLRGIPIIMITSRTAEKHRSYAFEIGVNDYLGKPYQEDELLRLVAGYVRQQRVA
jgi:chemosensory pili system protein ChpA (sensor histidine kinase/response regulator)